MRIVSVVQMRELEQQTFASGVTEDELQRRAAAEIARVVHERFRGGSVVGLVGAGNNGRDAWIAVENLLDRGWRASLFLTPRHAITDDEIGAFEAQSGRIVRYAADEEDGGLGSALQGASIALDGLLGIGAKGAPRPPLDAIIETLNRAQTLNRPLEVVAVDTPSGLDPDTGDAPGLVVRADLTVVLGGLKQGLLTASAARFTGELVPVEIGVVDGPPGTADVLTLESLRGLLPPRPPDAHKGTFGRLLVVAGSDQYVGAAYLVCAAAVRAGAGIVALAAPRWLRDVVAARLPEVTYVPLPDGGPAANPDECIERLADRVAGFDALAIGPGLSTAGGVQQVVHWLIGQANEASLPLVVDADALNVLAAEPGWADSLGPKSVITPHPGELARLLGGKLPDEAPWALAERLGKGWGITLVVKGAFTAVGGPDGVWVHPRANPGLATAGTGDVLTGIIGGLLARGLDPTTAARLGVWAHGTTAATLTQDFLAGGLAASDLLPEIPWALAELVENR